jgi:site-specific recombinase XerD
MDNKHYPAIIGEQPSELTSIEIINEKANEYINQAKSPNTKKAYRNDLTHFVNWCSKLGVQYLPASVDTVKMYLTALAEMDYKVSTITRRVSAISQAHQAAGFDSPTHALPIRALMAGIRRTKGTAQTGKAPTMTEDIREMVETLPENLLGERDAALLLLGFAGAFRRSELVSLDVEDLAFTKEGLKVTLRKSKTDQEGQGITKGIAYGSHPTTCPVRAMQQWLESSRITSGPVFRSINRHGQIQAGRLSDKAVALVVKRQAEAAGLNPADYSGHSLRAGLATSAANAGVGERAIMKQTGHKSTAMVRKYIRWVRFSRRMLPLW